MFEHKFYLVWCPQGGPPRYRHEQKIDAQNEAKRLAAENPSRQFYVLAAFERYESTQVSVTKLPDPPPPF